MLMMLMISSTLPRMTRLSVALIAALATQLSTTQSDGQSVDAAAVGGRWDAAAADELSFMVMGDWGGISKPPYSTPAESHAAQAMAELARLRNASFVLAVGDNFYREGIPNVRAARAPTGQQRPLKSLLK